MIKLRKTRLIMVLAVACVFSAAYGQQNEQAERQLQFETSGTINPTRYFTEVTHFGYFHVVEDRSFSESWNQEWLTKTSQWNQMSQKQRQFILKLQNDYQYRSTARKKNISRPFSIKTDHISTPDGTVTYCVLGVSEEDVRKMAEAVIERFDNRIHNVREVNQKHLESSKNVIAEAEKILPKLEKECKQLETQADKKTKEYAKNNYAIDSMSYREEILNYARKNMEELARYLRLANFELIGLQAKIDSIERFKAGGKISDQGTLVKLDQMLIADEIERAGVMARKNAYEEAFKQTKELYDVIMSSNDAAAQKLGWEQKLEKAKNAKNDLERTLANPPKEMQPVEVHENKVFIWQVKQD